MVRIVKRKLTRFGQSAWATRSQLFAGRENVESKVAIKIIYLPKHYAVSITITADA